MCPVWLLWPLKFCCYLPWAYFYNCRRSRSPLGKGGVCSQRTHGPGGLIWDSFRSGAQAAPDELQVSAARIRHQYKNFVHPHVVAILDGHRLDPWQDLCLQALQLLVPFQSLPLVEPDGVHLVHLLDVTPAVIMAPGALVVMTIRGDVIIIKYGDAVILVMIDGVGDEALLIGERGTHTKLQGLPGPLQLGLLGVNGEGPLNLVGSIPIGLLDCLAHSGVVEVLGAHDDGDEGCRVSLDDLLDLRKVDSDWMARPRGILEVLTSLKLSFDPEDGPDGDVLKLENILQGVLCMEQHSHCNLSRT